MKYLALIALALIAVACKRSEFDVSPDQVAKKQFPKGPGKGGFLDMKHLPPGAVVHSTKFKKGDLLPDGRTADGDVMIKRVEVPGKGEGGLHNERVMSEDVFKK